MAPPTIARNPLPPLHTLSTLTPQSTQTPSPHRFLTKPRPPPSSLRTIQRPTAASSSSSQFAPTPRFSLSSTRTKQEDDAIQPSSSPPAPTSASTSPLVSRTRPRVQLRRGEEIEDSEEEEGRKSHERRGVFGDVDGNRELRPDHADEGFGARSRSRKRRRLSIETETGHDGPIRGGEFPPTTTTRQDEVIAISSSPPPPSSPSPSPSPSPSDTAEPQHPAINPAPSLPLPTTTATKSTTAPPPRFVFPPSTPSLLATTTTTTSSASATVFLRPPTLPASELAEPDPTLLPLPELFSPHRRGQKFLPDGLAATVRDWVVEVAQEAVGSRRSAGRRRGRNDGVEGEGQGDGVRMRVLDVWADGGDGSLVIVRGRNGGGEERKWMLLGSGGRGEEVHIGVVVVVRVPLWEVEVRGERCGVGVEWRVDGGGGS